MLFQAIGRPRSGITSQQQQELLKLWASWQPPEGLTIQSFHFAPDGTGYILVDSDSVEAVVEATYPWVAVYMDYEVVPVIPVEQAVEISERAIAFREKTLA